jgi:urea transport system ATP-binding protein
VARCLVLRPKILLLDEPTEGLQPSIVLQLEEALRSIREEFGLGMLLVEQNLDFAFAVSERGYVLEKGEVVADGPTEDLRDAAVIKEYLAI